MNPAKLHKMTINIIFSLNEKNMALFLSKFFEACGIVSTKYDRDYLPEKMIRSSTTINIVAESDLNKVEIHGKSKILLIHSNKDEPNCYDKIDIKNCEKILNYLYDKWGMPNLERDELNSLFRIYVKNNLWKISWLVENIQSARNKEKISDTKIVDSYIEKSIHSFQKDLDEYNWSHPNDNHYLHHMQLYSLYKEYDIISSSMDRYLIFEKKIENEGFVKLIENNPYNYLGKLFLWARFYKNFQENYALYYYDELEKKYPNSEVLYQLEYLVENYGWDKDRGIYDLNYDRRKYKSNKYLRKAYQADPTNYLALYEASKDLFLECEESRNDSKNIWRYFNMYNYFQLTALELLDRSTIEEYTEVSEIRAKIHLMTNTTRLVYDIYYHGVIDFGDNFINAQINALKELKEELENAKLFQNLFEDMSYQNNQNVEVEECVRNKIMKLAYKKLNSSIEWY